MASDLIINGITYFGVNSVTIADVNGIDHTYTESAPVVDVPQGAYKIVAAELPGVTFKLYQNNSLLQSLATPVVTGGIVNFILSDSGAYNLIAVNNDSVELWSKEVIVDDIGVYVVKVPDMLDGTYAMNRYTNEEHHLIRVGGYASIMFSPKSKFNFRQPGSICDDYDLFIEEIERQENGSEAVYMRMCSPYTGASYNMTTRYSYLPSASGVTWSNGYSGAGGYKYSEMIQRFMLAGEDVYIQATSIKPDGSAAIEGIEFSQLYYTDTCDRAYIYSYVAASDSFTKDDAYATYGASSQNEKFIKGYFLKVGKITKEAFNAGIYYAYNPSSFRYTRATSYGTSAEYYGLYEKLQSNGIFYDAFSSLHQYMIRLNDKSSTGLKNTTYLAETHNYVDIPAVETITGTNKDTVLFSNKNSRSAVNGTSMYSCNVAGEGSKRAAYDAFDLQAAGGDYWTQSAKSDSAANFCYFTRMGNLNGYTVYSALYVRLGFKLL